MLRVVLDANVLVSAAIGRDGPSLRVLHAWTGGAFEVVTSPRLLEELDAVLGRPAVASRTAAAARTALTDALDRSAIHLDDPPAERVARRDAADDRLVALARAAGAAAIVTGDRHLLDLEGLRPPALEPAAFLALLDRLP